MFLSSTISKNIMACPCSLIAKLSKEWVGGGAEVGVGDENFYLENIILKQRERVLDSWLISPNEFASWELSKYCHVTMYESSVCSRMMGTLWDPLSLWAESGQNHLWKHNISTTSAPIQGSKALGATCAFQVGKWQWTFHLFGSLLSNCWPTGFDSSKYHLFIL